MDAPTYEQFPSQSWESWHQSTVETMDDTHSSRSETTMTFDADAVVRQAVAQRGTPEDRRSMGMDA